LTFLENDKPYNSSYAGPVLTRTIYYFKQLLIRLSIWLASDCILDSLRIIPFGLLFAHLGVSELVILLLVICTIVPSKLLQMWSVDNSESLGVKQISDSSVRSYKKEKNFSVQQLWTTQFFSVYKWSKTVLCTSMSKTWMNHDGLDYHQFLKHEDLKLSLVLRDPICCK